MIYLNSFFISSIKAVIALDANISEGFGGIFPAVIIVKFSLYLLATSSNNFFLNKSSAVPAAFDILNFLCIEGFLISQSTNKTLLPLWAKAIAKFPEVVDFPSPGTELVTTITLYSSSKEEYSILDLKLL